MGSELRPRVCFLTKGKQDYGFHLHPARNRSGQLIRKIEPGSCAELSGLRPGDRVVEVNGENVEQDSHQQVVERIREVGHRTRLLVIDRETDDYLRSYIIPCTEDLAVEMGTFSPRPPTTSAAPLRRPDGPISPKELLKRWAKPPETHSPADSFTDRSSSPPRSARTDRASVASSSGTDAEAAPPARRSKETRGSAGPEAVASQTPRGGAFSWTRDVSAY